MTSAGVSSLIYHLSCKRENVIWWIIHYATILWQNGSDDQLTPVISKVNAILSIVLRDYPELIITRW